MIHVASFVLWNTHITHIVGSTGSAMNDLYELNLQGTAGQEPARADALVEAGRAHTQNGPETGGGLSSSAPAHEGAAPAAWRQVPPAGGGVAVHRFCHVGAVHRGSLYVFGGYDGTSRLNDFVALDLAAGRLRATEVPPPTLLADLRSFLDDEDVMALSDITLMVEGVPVRAHKLMLVRSPYFRAMLLGEMAEASQKIVTLEHVRLSTVKAVLEYLYTDAVAVPLESAMELFVAADLFDLPRLRAMCEKRLLEAMTVENAATVFLAADVHSATALRERSLGYILLHFEAVSTTVAFEDMVRSNVELVFEILKSR